jgi:flagellar biosynthesis protein FlhF
MRIKTFTGHTLREATDQMKQELGPEAVVLATRKTPRGGAFSFLGRDFFEVTGAIDEGYGPPGGTSPRAQGRAGFQRYLETAEKGSCGDDPVEDLRRIAEHFDRRGRNEEDVRPAGPTRTSRPEFHALQAEMLEVKGTLRDIVDHLKYSRMPSLPDSLRTILATLLENDVDEHLAADIVQKVYAQLAPDQVEDRKAAEERVLAAMASLVHTPGEARARRKRARILALVGPTGVGKTTTVAKLAAIHKLVDHARVGLISADTYKIGAIEQLRTFAAIADIPMEVAYRPAEVALAVKKFRDKDLVLLDTVGRSQRSKKELSELAKFLTAADPEETHLVVSASTAVRTAHDIINQFRVLKPNRILFSKLDEAVTLGPLLSILHRHALPLSFVTTGQTVPDDIVRADGSRLASLIYRGVPAHA